MLTLITLVAWYWFSKRHTKRMKMMLPEDTDSEMGLMKRGSEVAKQEKANAEDSEL
jgi:hypothetical protein